jgi:hypothetical protein
MPAEPHRDRLPRSTYAAIALLSVGVLVLQIALNRVFSFTTWHHLAYISVSLALLGFGASGSVLAAFPGLAGARLTRALGLYAGLASLGTLLALLAVGSWPPELGSVLRDAGELARLVATFGAVTAPFFFAGLAIAVALREAGPRVNRLYAWDLVGAGLGCSLAVASMNALGAPGAMIGVAVCFAGAGAIGAGRSDPALRNANLALLLIAAALLGPLPRSLPFAPSSDKLMAPFAETGITHASHWTALFRTDLIGGRGEEMVGGGYRIAGASPLYEAPGPEFRLIFHDGGAAAILYRFDPADPGPLEMFRHHILTTPYRLLEEPDVLVIGVGGGADVVNAIANGARHVTGVELDPVTVELIRERFADYSGGIFERPDVDLRVGEGRHFLRSTEAGFDLIQMSGVDTLAALSSGAYVLAENYLYTAEAFGELLDRLRPGGLMSVAASDFHWTRGYPRHALRFCSLAVEALRRRGVREPHAHVAVLAGEGGLFEVVIGREALAPDAVAALEQFAIDEGFELWYLPGRPERQLPEFRSMLESAGRQRSGFISRTFLDLRAPTDDRPFFFSFYKWRHLHEHRDEVDPGHLLATGQLVLVLILAIAVAFSALAIGLPLLRAGGEVRRLPGRWGLLAYFAALGAGFIFAEISTVQRFLLFLGHPTYSLSVILFSFLVSAGGGAAWSGRLPPEPSRVLPRLVAALTITLLAWLWVTPRIFEALLAAPLPLRVAVTFALCAPLGAILGSFFPYGLRLTSTLSRDFSAWAWAVNGCLTVVGSVATIMIATTWGFTTVLLLVLVIYWLGALAFVRGWERARGGAAA